MLAFVEAVAGYARPVSPPATFSVARGEVVGLTGPNGIGKSTLLKAALGSAHLFAGRIERLPGARLAYLPQQPVRLAEMPVAGHELLAVSGARHMTPPARLAEKLSRRIDRLSGGEYQLLMLWTALAGEAELVLLDEPTNNLDAGHIQTAIDEIDAARPHRATLVVSQSRPRLSRHGVYAHRRPGGDMSSLFVIPFFAGLLLASLLPLVGNLLRLRDEWLATLGLAHLAAAGALAGMALSWPASLGALAGAWVGAGAKQVVGGRSNSAYGLMILAGWAATLLVAANT
ncbi:MAG: ATP-binding cassette domain-containing protein, partial [Rhodocyclaceae bacterium]